MKRVPKSQLGTLEFIAEGGAGRVHRVVNPVSGLPSPLAYKEVRTDVDPKVQQAAKKAMVDAVVLRDAMPAADQAELDTVTTWPFALVEDGGADVGVLMPLLGPDFFIATKPPGKPAGRRVFELQLLSASDKLIQGLGIDRSEADDDLVRLALMARLAYAFELIHRHPDGLVYGDLNLKNAAIATNPPRLMLLDCDGVARLSDQSRDQMLTLFFKPPEIVSGQQRLQDKQTDVYKLGLCVIRGLARGPGVTQISSPTNNSMIPGLLDQTGIDLLERAVGADRSRRPTAEDLKDYLVERVHTLVQPPELLSAAINCRTLLRGSQAIVTWSHRHATKLRIHGVNGFEVQIPDPDGHPHGYAIQPPTSGPILVEAINKHGTDQIEAGYIDYCELPPFDIQQQLQGFLPRLAMPEFAPVQIPDALAALPAHPMVSTDAHPVPRFELPSISVDASGIGLGGVDPSAGPVAVSGAVSRAIEDANRLLLKAIEEEAAKSAPTISNNVNQSGRKSTP